MDRALFTQLWSLFVLISCIELLRTSIKNDTRVHADALEDQHKEFQFYRFPLPWPSVDKFSATQVYSIHCLQFVSLDCNKLEGKSEGNDTLTII